MSRKIYINGLFRGSGRSNIEGFKENGQCLVLTQSKVEILLLSTQFLGLSLIFIDIIFVHACVCMCT